MKVETNRCHVELIDLHVVRPRDGLRIESEIASTDLGYRTTSLGAERKKKDLLETICAVFLFIKARKKVHRVLANLTCL